MAKLHDWSVGAAFCSGFRLIPDLHLLPGVVRLLRDRYFAYDQRYGCDLATGEMVRLDDLRDEPAPRPEPALAPLIEVLNSGCEADPRWLVAEARSGAQAAALARRAALHARRHGFVPILAQLYARLREALAEDLNDRTLLVIATADRAAGGRQALIDAAARSPRPHLLLTFRTGSTPRAGTMVREARAAYGGEPPRHASATRSTASDVVRHLARAGRASEFQRRGRHAAAERLLRDVAATLTRRDAHTDAAATLVTLARMLLERGRAADAEMVCEEAERVARAGGDDAAALEARLWQVAARTDAGRLTSAESLCRALILAGGLTRHRLAWAHALLARVLLWQRRIDEAVRLDLQAPTDAATSGIVVERPPHDLDQTVEALIDATATRVLIAAGEVFEAGQRARMLLARADRWTDPLPRAIAYTAHLRVLVAAGDLALAEQILGRALELARQARSPLRSARAMLVWHDALRRGRRRRDAARVLGRLRRICRVSPPLLREAIGERLSAADRIADAPATLQAHRPASPVIRTFVQIAQEEESELDAVRRIIERLAGELRASRIDVSSCDAGPVSTLATVGTGGSTHLGPRVLESGLALPVETHFGGHETGAPVRLGTRVVAALVCRWPIDRQPPPGAVDLVELAASIMAPRVDALIANARDRAGAAAAVPELLGASEAMGNVRGAIERAARAPFAVLIEGESGAGKELAARAIHQLSPRRERRFCDLNCAALPEDLLESELFGHARGAFTGAVADKPGLFEEADGGTLFLDELPDLSPRGQAKLLRVLQQHEVRRVGETFSRPIDVRLVAATNRDMRTEAAEGRFRQDLLYRIDVLRIRIPPLRERPEDVPVLARHVWRAAAARVGSNATLAHGVLSALARYHWPGNVRELQNVIAALAVAAPSRGTVKPSLLPATIAGAEAVASRRLADARAQFERRCLEVALARAGGNRSRAAADLGLTRQGFLKTMARLGLRTESAG